MLATFLTLVWMQVPATSSCAGLESRLAEAARLMDAGDLPEAGRVLRSAQVANPQCDDVLLALGRVHAAQGDVNSAREFLWRFISVAPRDAKNYYAVAQLALIEGNPAQADAASAMSLALNPDYSDALVLRGQIVAMKGDARAARRLLEKACRLAPSSAEAQFQLGQLFDREGQPAEAVTQFRKVVTIRPKDPRAWDYLALNLERLGEPENAEAAYKSGLKVNSGPLFDSFLDYNYGRYLMKRSRLAEGKVHLDRAVQLAPETRAVYYEHARINLRLNRAQEARADAEKALGLADPGGFILDLQIYYLLSTIYSRLGQSELAHKYAELSRTTGVPANWSGRK